MIDEYSIRNPKIDLIINVVCDELFVTRESLFSSSRKKEISVPRQCCMLMLFEFKINKHEYSLETIGDHLGDKDHSTVMHGIKTIKNEIGYNVLLRQKVQDLRTSVALALNVKGHEVVKDEFREEASFETPDENTFYFLNPVNKPLEEVEE
jgi:isopentenyl diphosphate isomerase/L-lactate dehydrogenase-like FMN-dependent dehydrogenase